jgi:ketosteroid isomerase-like protein
MLLYNRNTHLDPMKRQILMASNAARLACKIRNETLFATVDGLSRGIYVTGDAVGTVAVFSKIATTSGSYHFIQES